MKKLASALVAQVVAVLLGSPAFGAETMVARAPRIDINTATAEQLKATLGIGDDVANRIVAARPYARKDDLKTREVLPASEFEKIRKLIESVC
jgi:competence protein ComEA